MGTARTFNANEVAALLDIPVGKVRKDLEYGVFGSDRPPRFSFEDLVYFDALRRMPWSLAVDERKDLLSQIRRALDRARGFDQIAQIRLATVLILELGSLVREVNDRVETFSEWRERLVSRPDVLGGELVFPGTRLAVRRIGGLAERGEPVATIREDYPYLSPQDVEFAQLYVRAYPRVGRPREQRQAPPR